MFRSSCPQDNTYNVDLEERKELGDFKVNDNHLNLYLGSYSRMLYGELNGRDRNFTIYLTLQYLTK